MAKAILQKAEAKNSSSQTPEHWSEFHPTAFSCVHVGRVYLVWNFAAMLFNFTYQSKKDITLITQVTNKHDIMLFTQFVYLHGYRRF